MSDILQIDLKITESSKNNFQILNSNITYNNIESCLKKGQRKCYFLKKSENKFLFVIPIEELAGHAEFLVEYNGNFFDIITNRNGKASRFISRTELPSVEFSLSRLCTFKFMLNNEFEMDFSVLQAIRDLYTNLCSLPIEVRNDTKEQREIWTKYIKAQRLIIDNLQEPISCIGAAEISPNPNDENFEEPNKYKIEVKLHAEKANEHRLLEETLSEKFHLETHIDASGACYMTLDDIFRALDPTLKKYFNESVVREKKINCILGIRPYYTFENFQKKYAEIMDFERKYGSTFLEVCNLKLPLTEVEEILLKENYKLTGCGAKFYVVGFEDLTVKEIVDKFNVTFSETPKRGSKKWDKYEIILPYPTENCFTIEFHEEFDPYAKSEMLYQSLCYIYGTENVKSKYYYKFIDENAKRYSHRFGHDEWTDICKDLFEYEDWLTLGDSNDGKTIHFDFETKEEFVDKYNKISNLNRFVIKKSPLDEDFKFKVNTSIISEKSLRRLFEEKLEKLAGTEFVVENIDQEGKKEFVYIGKLISSESNVSKLVFILNNYFDEDKRRAKDFIKFWKRNPKFNFVKTDLRGDAAKCSWLDFAMSKISEEDKWGLNNKPINENIKNFIFDSSRAKSTDKYKDADIENTQEFKSFDKYSILKLNDSQKKSVLRAIHAEELCMLQGPPGTGKTTVIAELIWQLIRVKQNSRILLTSETNLAVDNALEKLMNEKNINPLLARYITLIKPIRFGKTSKFEEEGKRYSIERIEKWIDSSIEIENEYENDGLNGEDFEEEDSISSEENVVNHWMSRIASRKYEDEFKYREVLKEWQNGLNFPDQDSKLRFKESYLKHANVIGSTCCSTGSPCFQKDYFMTFLGLTKNQVNNILSVANRLSSNNTDIKLELIEQTLSKVGIKVNLRNQEDLENLKQTLRDLYTIKFDCVIMDEASKATPPELLLPICYAQKSIVIGDHRQLPPMLNEKSFKEALLDLKDPVADKLSEEIDREFVETSQFKRLILNPNLSNTIKSTFNVQYRMHQYINDVISQFYKKDECGGLQCGLDPMKMDSPDLKDPQSRYHGLSYPGFISPNVHTIWVDVHDLEESDGSSKINISEVEAINYILSLLKKSSGFSDFMKYWDYAISNNFKQKEEKEIGIISFYGKQVKKIHEIVRPHAKYLGIPVRVKTVDRFQGMERNIIIVSTVRSNKHKKQSGIIVNNIDPGFAKSPERLNVGLSRARRLLIVVGNRSFFSSIKDREGNFLYRNAIEEIEKNGLIIDYNDLKRL